MGFSKRHLNIKLGTSIAAGAVGPQGLNAATTYVSAAVPCKGAKYILFHLSATDANALASFTGNVGEDVTGALLFAGSGQSIVNIGGVGRMNASGGLTLGIAPPTAAGGRWPWLYVSLSIVTHATLAHTAVQCDVEVVYEGEADAFMQSNGQLGVVPV